MFSIASISILVLLIPTILVVTVAAFFIYKAIYDKHTNKVLESGETQKRRWIAPWAMSLIVLGAQLLIVAGVMFPLSLLMVDPASQQHVEATEDQPLNVDVSDSVKYVIYDPAYENTGTFENYGVTIECFVRENADGTSNNIFIGTIDSKDINGPINVTAELVNKDGECFATASCTLVDVSAGTDVIYFMCECLSEDRSGNELNVGVNYGTAIYTVNEAAVQFSCTLG